MVFDALSSELSIDKRDYTRGLKAAASETLAFGKTAEGTFEDVGDEAAEAGAEAGASSFGFRKLGETLKDTITPAKLLSSTLDEAGDEASEAGRSAFGATAGFAALRISTTGLSFSLGALTTVGTSTTLMLGGLAIAAGALATAMLPVIVGLGAIAAAFGVIIGAGIFAGMKQLKKAFKSATKEIKPMIKELGQKFVPFLKETIQMLPGLVKNIIDAIGPLDKFLGALRTLRNAAFDLLPKFIKWWMDLGRWAIPIVTELGNWIVNSLAPALRSTIKRGKRLYKTFTRLAPKFQKIIDVARGVWKWIQNLWKSFQKTVKNSSKLRKKVQRLIKAARKFWTNLQPVIKALKPLAKQLIKLAPVIAAVALDVARLALNLGAKLLPYLVPLINIVTRIVKWFNNLAPPVKKAILLAAGLALAIGPLISVLGTVIGVIAAVIGSISLIGIAIAGLILGIVLLADYVYKNWNEIKKWTKTLVSDIVWWFDELGRRAHSAVTGAINDIVSWLKNVAKTDIIGVFSSIASGIGNAFKNAFNDVIPDSVQIPSITIGEGVPGPDITIGGGSLDLPSLDTGGLLKSDGLFYGHAGERVLNAAEVDRGVAGTGQQPPPNVNVNITIDTKDDALQEWVDNRADVVVKDTVENALRQGRRRGTL